MASHHALATEQGPTSVISPAVFSPVSETTTTSSLEPCELDQIPPPPRIYPTDLKSAILEETESESESPNEPITPPVSGRQSRELTAVRTRDNSDIGTVAPGLPPSNALPVAATKHPLDVDTGALRDSVAVATTPPSPNPRAAYPLSGPTATPADRYFPANRPTRSRRPSFSSTTASFRRSFSSVTDKVGFFRRNAGKESGNSSSAATSVANLNGQAKAATDRGSSLTQSASTTRSNTPPSNTPPSPRSPPSEMHLLTRDPPASGPHKHGQLTPPAEGLSRVTRASTGLGAIRGRAVDFVHSSVSGRDKDKKKPKRRANSFDGRKEKPLPLSTTHQGGDDEASHFVPAERLPWPYPPNEGTGAKARRMSLSLPDDFTVDVAELLSEYEYLQKFLGRHGKHLGKGATSKVTLMMRKGCPNELYAVKEFRGKSGRESPEEYEKKVKSEYSIAKSLHHPNIVETVRLCTDHGRWNHVMEYCAEGDLFGLVEKGYLKHESRAIDRYCLFKQLVQGVNYLHSNGIAHRDIKLENLLITRDSKLKITDFGVSEVFSGIHPGLRESGGVCGKNMGEVRLCDPGICGSEPYIAPEVLAKKTRYDPRALDVWSSAIIMIQLIFGGSIWSKADPSDPNYSALAKGWAVWDSEHAGEGEEESEEDAGNSRDGEAGSGRGDGGRSNGYSISSSNGDGTSSPRPLRLPTETDYPHVVAFDRFVKPPALRRLLLRMLSPDPDRRISIADVLTSRWMKSVDCCQLESYEDPTPIDVSKKDAMKFAAAKKIYCHNHLPPMGPVGAPSIGIMPGKPGY